jgi:hypothetical protein
MSGLYLVTVEAEPSADTDDSREYGGAYVNVYIQAASEAAALAAAQREIAQAGWACKAIDRVTYVTREDFTNEDDGLESFEQALIDGVRLDFHTFPIGAEDDDAVH